jgi:hypothetical protein
MRGAPLSAVVPILILVAATVGPVPHAQAQGDDPWPVYDEIPTGRIAPRADAADLTASDRSRDPEIELEILGGVQTLVEEDMDATYDLVPSAGLGISAAVSPTVRVLVAASYGEARGDPYHGEPEFYGGESRLRIVPLEVGIRVDMAGRTRTRLLFAAGFSVAWVQETLPVEDESGERIVHDGYGAGVSLALGPEFRSRDGMRALGFQLGWGRSGLDLESGRAGSRELDLTGFRARLYLVTRI